MYYASNLEQLINFGYFICIGAILSIIFDIFRILRKSIKTSDIITNIEDVLFAIISGIILVFSIFTFNKGELRLYIFLGIFIGIILYMLFISKYFIKINLYIINFVKLILSYVLKPFIYIQKLLKKLIFKPILFIFVNFKKNFLNFYKKITKKRFKKKDFDIFCRK